MSDETQSTVPPEVPLRQSPEPLWDLDDVARFLKVAPRTIYRWASEGKIPHSRVGAQYRFVPAVIREWVTAGQSGPSEPAEGVA
jgi:excisionase family DNA binding protein